MFPSLPEYASLSDVFSKFPARSKALFPLLQNIMRDEPSAFSSAERELIAAYVSKLNACDYCAGAHEGMALALGLNPQLITELENGIDSNAVPEKLRPVLQFVEKLTLTPTKMTERDAKEVYAAGWDEDALFDAIAVCALFNLMNRIVEGTGCHLIQDNNDDPPSAIENYEDWGKQLGLN